MYAYRVPLGIPIWSNPVVPVVLVAKATLFGGGIKRETKGTPAISANTPNLGMPNFLLVSYPTSVSGQHGFASKGNLRKEGGSGSSLFETRQLKKRHTRMSST